MEKNCIRQEQFASNPQTPPFPLMASNAKTIDGTQKSPTQNPLKDEL